MQAPIVSTVSAGKTRRDAFMEVIRVTIAEE